MFLGIFAQVGARAPKKMEPWWRTEWSVAMPGVCPPSQLASRKCVGFLSGSRSQLKKYVPNARHWKSGAKSKLENFWYVAQKSPQKNQIQVVVVFQSHHLLEDVVVSFLFWIPKPWKLKVLIPKNTGEITPKNNGNVGSDGCQKLKERCPKSFRFPGEKSESIASEIRSVRWYQLRER